MARWSLIAGRLPGRTDIEVKNYWNSHIRRKLISNGIDPDNHRLSQNVHPLQNPSMCGSSKPSSLEDENCKNKPIKPQVEHYGQDSDAASSEEVESYALPALNLDLSL
ncbi:unnamed protein product [Lupinus luteus]|uniref:Uncharacterized protein n=1 Tax=Lupinus luteus TaxID=3873 RepID=A0AAV1YE71_LUPLU